MSDSASFDCILSARARVVHLRVRSSWWENVGVCKATERCMCFNRTTVALFLRFLLELFFGNSLVNIIEWNHTALNCDCSGFSVVGKCHCYQLILRITAQYLIWIFMILQREQIKLFSAMWSLSFLEAGHSSTRMIQPWVLLRELLIASVALLYFTAINPKTPLPSKKKWFYVTLDWN